MTLRHVRTAAAVTASLATAIVPAAAIAKAPHSAHHNGHHEASQKAHHKAHHKGEAPLRVKVLASALNSPKHLTYAKGKLYVAESGTGGSSNCVTGPSTEGPGETEYCAGKTASISVIKGKHVKTAAGHLASMVDRSSNEATGPAAVAVTGKGKLVIVFQAALVNEDGTNNAPEPAKRWFGKLLLPNGRSVDLAAFAAKHPQDAATLGGTPGETTYDSDPYSVISYKKGYLATDAAANSLLSISKKGKVKLLARFPTTPESVPAGVLGPVPLTVDAQAVPTSVAVGPDGAIYVGFLRGVPSLPGTADIYRVVPGHSPKLWAKGLTAVTSIAFDSKGRLLATEFSTGGLLAPPTVEGALVRVSANGKHVTTLPVKGLFQPTGVAVSPSNTVYVSNYGVSPGSAKPSGEILKITGLR